MSNTGHRNGAAATPSEAAPPQPASLSEPLIALFKGVVYRDEQPQVWQSLLRLETRVREYVAVLGLQLHVDEGEGFAFLRQLPLTAEGEELPRLIPQRQLPYTVSLLLALLRKRLAEHDASGGDPRLILTKEQIVEAVRVFLPATTDEVRLHRRVETALNRAVELGFVRRLKGQADAYEVRRILASFVDAQWLSELEERLAAYREYGEQAFHGADQPLQDGD